MLEWNCYLRPAHPQWEGPEDILSTNTLRRKFVTGAQAPLKSSVITLLYRPDLTVGTTATQLKNLNAIGVPGSPDGRDEVTALDHQRQGGQSYLHGQQSQSSNQNRKE